MGEIALTNDGAAVVDDEDVAWLSRWLWRQNNSGYADRLFRISDEQTVYLKMHNAIADYHGWRGKTSRHLDHKNQNRLDNRKENLRWATYGENGANCKIRRNNKSGHRGIAWHSVAQKWAVMVGPANTNRYHGLYATIEEALIVRNEAYRTIYGDFAPPLDG